MGDSPPPRPWSASLAWGAATMAAGLAIRKLPLGLPLVVVKHGGSVAWALMIYAIASTLAWRWSPVRCGIAAMGITTAVETSQLLHLRALDAFRATGNGALLLGRHFSLLDVTVYAGSVWIAVAMDSAVRNRLQGGAGGATPGIERPA